MVARPLGLPLARSSLDACRATLTVAMFQYPKLPVELILTPKDLEEIHRTPLLLELRPNLYLR